MRSRTVDILMGLLFLFCMAAWVDNLREFYDVPIWLEVASITSVAYVFFRVYLSAVKYHDG